MGILSNYPIGLAPGMGTNFFCHVQCHECLRGSHWWEGRRSSCLADGDGGDSDFGTSFSDHLVHETAANDAPFAESFAEERHCGGDWTFHRDGRTQKRRHHRRGRQSDDTEDRGNGSAFADFFHRGAHDCSSAAFQGPRQHSDRDSLFRTDSVSVRQDFVSWDCRTSSRSDADSFQSGHRHGMASHTGTAAPDFSVFLHGHVRHDGNGPRCCNKCKAFEWKQRNRTGIERVFAADASATVAGALCGQSSVTSYLESAAGVEAGGRTGLTAIVIGMCFLLAMFFTPIITAVAGYPPVTSGALVVVGAMMIHSISEIRWDDCTEGIPAFLIFAGIPFSNSIIGGLSIGIILYPFLKKNCCGKFRELNCFLWLSAAVLILYLILLNGE